MATTTTTSLNSRESQCKRIYNFLVKINLFDDKETLTLVDQFFATRIFISLLIINLAVIITFTAFSIQTYTVTVRSPSESSFKQLALQYPSTLSCLCEQSAIRLDEFISFSPEYHPVCTSSWINQTFLSSLSNMNTSDYWPLDYRIMIASHLQILALLCRTTQQIVSDAVEQFSSEHIISDQVLLPDTFNIQAKAFVDQLRTTTIADSQYTSDFLWFAIIQNGIYSALRTNFYIQAVPGTDSYSYFTASYKSFNQTCSCKGNDSCVHQAGIYNWTGRARVNSSTRFGDLTTDPLLLFDIPGLMVGCLPYSSLLQSTLECFYNQSCIDLIDTSSTISPLVSSHFEQNRTVNDLLEELFLESWNNQNHFTNYFRVCSPHSCTYSYNRRFNLLYIIVTVIGLFGGLKLILMVSTPLILKFIRRLQNIRFSRNTNDRFPVVMVPDVNQNRTFSDRLTTPMKQIYHQIMTLNMFPFVSNIQNGLYSTRLYILLLISGILILVFYESISIRTRSITVHKPSLNDYERLYAQYSSTLVCSCTDLSVSYSSIMFIQPRYHQVCSSDFVRNDAWLLYTRGQGGVFFALDFRIIGMELFRILQNLCQISNKTVSNQLTLFNDTQFVSAQVVTNDTFNIQTSTLIRQFQQQTVSAFISLFDMIRVSMLLNQFIVAGNTNARLRITNTNDATSVRSVSRNDYDNGCSCGTSSTCTRPQGFYCTASSCFYTGARPNQTIPGLVVNCLPVDSLLLSSLECLYNASCIQMMIEWRSFGTPNSTIDPRVANVTPLDPMRNSRFQPNTSMSTVIGQLFIEDWANWTSFSAYYEQCAPHECVYTYEERFNTAFIISVLLGIIGGLSVALRILIPPTVKLLQGIFYHCCRSSLRDQGEIDTNASNNQEITYFGRTRQYIQTMNFYRKIKPNSTPAEPSSREDLLIMQRQQIATRFYIILLFFAMTIILLFVSLNSRIHSVIVSLPNESTFELLQIQYSSTLSCPCSQISIKYSKILSIEPSAYHQVCSSSFMRSTFIRSLWGSDTASSYYGNIDVKILSAQFRLLSALCTLAKNVVNRKSATFFSREFITINALTRSSFEIQMNSTIEGFIRQTPADFRRTDQYIIDMLRTNQLHNVFYTNWNLILSNANNNFIMSTYPIVYNGSDAFCSCDTSSTCTKSLLVNSDSAINLSGLVLGCLPAYGLRQSTLECLYDFHCLSTLADFANMRAIPDPLNGSLPSRFNPISSVTFGTLIDELFIESWINSSNYSAYLSTCAPSICRYTSTERNSILYLITTFLGLYGGLTVGLKLLVWNGLRVYWTLRQSMD